MAPRDPAKGSSETQNLCQNRETTERRELWRRHHLLTLRGQVDWEEKGGLGESQVASALVGLVKEMKRGLWGKRWHPATRSRGSWNQGAW